MSKNYSARNIGITTIILIAFTIAAFFLLNVERTALYYWAFSFLWASEIIFGIGLVFTKSLGPDHSKVFAKPGVFGVLFFYFAATLVCVFLSGLFKDNLNTFILLELGIIAVSAIIIVLILSFAKRIGVSDKNIITKRQFMDSCENRLYNLLTVTKDSEFHTKINKLYELFKYSDKIGASSLDDKIAARISELEAAFSNVENNKLETGRILDEVISLIDQRKAEISFSKRGGF